MNGYTLVKHGVNAMYVSETYDVLGAKNAFIGRIRWTKGLGWRASGSHERFLTAEQAVMHLAAQH